MVGSIEPEGTQNAWTTEDRTASAISRASAIDSRFCRQRGFSDTAATVGVAMRLSLMALVEEYCCAAPERQGGRVADGGGNGPFSPQRDTDWRGALSQPSATTPQCISMPPSTLMAWPVTLGAEAR